MVTVTHCLRKFGNLVFHRVKNQQQHFLKMLAGTSLASKVDANLFIQALMLSPSPYQDGCALFISMEPGRQRKESSLNSSSYLTTPPLCILRVSPRYHPSAKHRGMPSRICGMTCRLLNLHYMTGEWPWKQGKNTLEDTLRVY